MGTPKPCEKCGRDYFPLRRGYCHSCDMRRRSLFGYECSYIDAQPARAHVGQLVDAGVGLRQVARMAGLNRKAVQILMNGRPDRGSPPSKRIAATTAAKILAIEIPQVITADVVAGGDLVDAIGTIRRLQALVGFGYTRTYLGHRMGWTGNDAACAGNISRLMDPATGKVRAETARRVAAIFAELQLTPGPSDTARNEGRTKGWLLPMEWDEDELDRFVVGVDSEDEPLAEPTRLHFAETYVEMADVLMLPDADIAEKLGIEADSLARQKKRHAARIELERQGEAEIA